jgi:hypothetical protein
MRGSLFRVDAPATLFADAYLFLALLASRRVAPHQLWALPPYGVEGLRSAPAPVVLLVLGWTAFLALGCPGGRGVRPMGRAESPEGG